VAFGTRGLDAAVETHTGAKARLLDRCERANIDLSSRSSVAVYVNSYFRGVKEEDFDYSLNRDELESIVGPLLDKGFKRIETLLENAGYAPEQVALCVATGGMSNMPVVRRRLHEWFGPERVQIPDGTATLIAEGAAWIASDKAGLQLTKNVELVLARSPTSRS
jgi:molecular chaperone DnaK